MSNTRALLVVALLLAPPGVKALPWSKDMVDQPSVKPQEAEVREPVGSVPRDGKEPVRKPANPAEVVQGRIDAGKALTNPVAADNDSVSRGAVVYTNHCASCHGAGGKGDGPVGLKFRIAPMDLTTDYVQQQPDGQIFYTITHGGIGMPFYYDAIVAEDRWHLINYLKREFSRNE